jgi:glycosyltransferase involved in cell wall biosynthesis
VRIAQIAPVFESVPPRLYGGTERVVSYLTEELVAQGHEVTLFASGDSRTSARLVSSFHEALRLSAAPLDELAAQILLVEQVIAEADQFDVIHNHIDYLPFPMLRRARRPNVSTPHGRLDGAHWRVLVEQFPELPLSSISFAQRRSLPDANWVATVYHGIPADQHRFRARHGDYLAFVGRISPEKRVDRAIEIARGCGMPLKIAAKVSELDLAYFERQIRPLLDDPLVDFLGEVDEAGKDELLGNAHALLFPIDWPEPFGLVMIEALACGTPVIARACGSVPELIVPGRSGLIADTVDELALAARSVDRIDRAACRREAEARFSAERMADGYEAVYERLEAGAQLA